MKLEEAIALIRHGDKVAISGSVDMAPMALVRELIRAEVKGLHLVCSGSVGLNADMLVGSGAVDTIELSHVMLGESGLAPRFRRLAEQGAIRTLDHTCPGMSAAISAGAMGIPFIPVRGLLGTDYLQVRDDFKVIADPFEPGQEIVVVPAITPDVCIFHAYQADEEGNVIVSRSQNIKQLVQASLINIATVEETVTTDRLDDSLGARIPSAFLTAVVTAPYGAHPSGCPTYYEADRTALAHYANEAKTKETFDRYLSRHMLAYTDHRDYVRQYMTAKENAL